MLRNAGDSSGASGSKSDQQWTKEINCSMIIKTGCDLAKKLKANKFHELGPSTQDVQKNMINNLPNTMTNSMDINFRNQYGTDSLQNCTAQQSFGHQIESQSLSSIISQSLGANKKQVNLRVPQLLHPPSVMDTSASNCRLVTFTESSSINSNGTTNPLCMASSTVNATSMPGPSGPTVNLLKRAGTTENGLGTATDALLGQRLTRQRFGSGDWNLTSSLVVDRNMGSSANILEGSGETEDRQVDYILEGTDLDNYLTDIAILEDILKQ
ncbi:uncharacterized protein LOC144572892 [Carex rostrata]